MRGPEPDPPVPATPGRRDDPRTRERGGKIGLSRTWGLILLLIAPASIPYISHCLIRSPAGRPTGFVQVNLPIYMAKAREYFDRPGPHLTYSSPCDDSYQAPAIYFQPWSFVLGAAWRLTRLDPGLIWVGFGLLSGLGFGWSGLALYREYAGPDSPSQRLGAFLFFWGGGVMALAGVCATLVRRQPFDAPHLLRYDPGDGWWFQGLGRNLVFPHEAFFHALFLGSLLAAIRRRYRLATALAFALSLSHPFSGVELLAILVAWTALEAYYFPAPSVPRWFFFASLGLLAIHLGYYLGFLNLFPSHRALAAQLEMDNDLRGLAMLLAYGPVGVFAAWAVRRSSLALSFFGEPRNRLLLAWFFVAVVLANHEALIKPRQQLHFTRGYIWAPLFLTAAAPAGRDAGVRRSAPRPPVPVRPGRRGRRDPLLG